jgi:diguanylate cyclase (GGDEF)-like protein/PAS domain S-box-containing protein/putative nucleotidyltransferase with HDIG domain
MEDTGTARQIAPRMSDRVMRAFVCNNRYNELLPSLFGRNLRYEMFHESASPANARGVPTDDSPAASGEHERSLLAALVQASDDAILSKTLDGIITTWNASAERMFGYTAAEIIGKPKTVLYPSDRLHEEEEILERLRQGLPTSHFETVRLHKDGTPIDVSVTLSPIKDAAGQIVAGSAIIRDITERKRQVEDMEVSEVRYRRLFEAARDGVLILDANTSKITDSNPFMTELLGYSREELFGKELADLGVFKDEDEAHRAMEQLQRDTYIRYDDLPLETKSHERRDVEFVSNVYAEADRRVIQCNVRDITQRKQDARNAEREIRQSEERLRLAVEGSQLGTWHWNIRTDTQVWSKRCLQLMGRPGDRPFRVPALLETVHPDDRERINAVARRGFGDGGEVADEFRVVWPDGSIHWLAARGRTFLGDDGTPLRMEGILADITEQRQAEEQLRRNVAVIEQQKAALESHRADLLETNARLEDAVTRFERLATTDGLTGLKNHRAFQDRLKEECDRAVRYHSPVSLVLLDVDRFKHYNDTYGHPEGDTVLKQVAEILLREARSIDIVARYGGEEFVVVLPETDAEPARRVAERLRHAIASASWKQVSITASFGVATLSLLLPNAADLVGEADKAMYRSKYRGRNCVTHVMDTLDDETLDTRTLDAFNELVQTVSAGRWEMLVSASEQMKEMLVQSYDATIASWSRILDLRDKETEGHSERVTAMTVLLMRHLGMTDEQITYARWGALVHDIGKMGVPDQILHKPGPLTEAEWVVMRQHTTLAYEMLSTIKFLGPAIDIPYCHHEKWDGQGYPRGLKGDAIPQMARLFAVIDVYDALTSDRPYRKAWPEEEVRTYLRDQAGSQFDPSAVDSFFAILESERSAKA